MVREGVLGGPARERGAARGDVASSSATTIATAMDLGRAENARWPAPELDPWGRAKADGDLGFLATGLAFLDTPWTTIAAGISVPDPGGHRHATT